VQGTKAGTPKRKEKAMHEIDVRVRCSNRYCELVPENAIMGECVLEELLYRVLAPFFDVIFIEDVTLAFWPTASGQVPATTIALRAQGHDLLSSPSLDHLTWTIKERLTQALTELLGSPYVERCAIRV
jgi:hypothetical protein